MSLMSQKYYSAPEVLTTCPIKHSCSGCQYLDLAYGAQTQLKLEALTELLKQHQLASSTAIEVLSAGASGLRDRLDFTLRDGKLGLYDKNKLELLDIPVCAQLSRALQSWLNEFRQISWPFKQGSVRLRVGPQGQKGVWLDFANVDIKTLLEEKAILHKLQKLCFIEIGQRRKVPVWTGHEFKLRDPETQVWFQTWVQDQPVDLHCHIASFTQPSLHANKIICEVITKWIASFPAARLIEFGSGIGNLTLPALAASQHLTACEVDALSLEALKINLENLPPALRHLQTQIEIHAGDFQKKIKEDFSQFDGILVNPPRSGLMNFLDPLQALSADERPPFFIYMSCFPESMVTDLQRLRAWGYEMTEVFIVDQFPQTKHYEVLVLLQRKKL